MRYVGHSVGLIQSVISGCEGSSIEPVTTRPGSPVGSLLRLSSFSGIRIGPSSKAGGRISIPL